MPFSIVGYVAARRKMRKLSYSRNDLKKIARLTDKHFRLTCNYNNLCGDIYNARKRVDKLVRTGKMKDAAAAKESLGRLRGQQQVKKAHLDKVRGLLDEAGFSPSEHHPELQSLLKALQAKNKK